MTTDRYRREGAEAMRAACVHAVNATASPIVGTPYSAGGRAFADAIRAIDVDEVLAGLPAPDAVARLVEAARAEAEKAIRKFPQPNYVISKVAEEAGEVVKAAIHCAEGREKPENVRAEIVQAMAMLIRLYVEGDQVHGLPALAQKDDEYAALNQHLRGDGDAPTAGGRLIASAAEAAVAAWHTRALAAEAEVERLREALERIESASRHWAAYEAAPDAVHYAHETTARLARAALAEGGPDDH